MNQPLEITPEMTEGSSPIQSIDEFAAMIGTWHKNRMDQLYAVGKMPSDGGITLEYDGEDVIMQGDVHKGFLMAIQYAVGIFGTLPFAAEVEEDEPAA